MTRTRVPIVECGEVASSPESCASERVGGMRVSDDLEMTGHGKGHGRASTLSEGNLPERTDFRLRSGAHARVPMPRGVRSARRRLGEFPERTEFRLRSYTSVIVPKPGPAAPLGGGSMVSPNEANSSRSRGIPPNRSEGPPSGFQVGPGQAATDPRRLAKSGRAGSRPRSDSASTAGGAGPRRAGCVSTPRLSVTPSALRGGRVRIGTRSLGRTVDGGPRGAHAPRSPRTGSASKHTPLQRGGRGGCISGRGWHRLTPLDPPFARGEAFIGPSLGRLGGFAGKC